MKRSIAAFIALAVTTLVTFVVKADQDPAAQALAVQEQSLAAQSGEITAQALPSSMGTFDERIARGFAIAPVALNLKGKNRAFVGLGSYIVNAQGGARLSYQSAIRGGGRSVHGSATQGQRRRLSRGRHALRSGPLLAQHHP